MSNELHNIDELRPSSIVTRLTLVVATLATVLVIGISLLSYYSASDLLFKNALAGMEGLRDRQARYLEHYIQEHTRNSFNKSKHQVISDYLKNPDATRRKSLEEYFALECKMDGYASIALINAMDGSEIVKVQRSSDGQMRSLEDKLLSHHWHEAWFQQSLNAPINETSVSPIHLNRMRDGIERPHRPIQYFSTAVHLKNQHNISNKAVAFLVLATEAQTLLDGLETIEHVHSTLRNGDGTVVKHMQSDREWSHQLRGSQAYQDNEQALWDAFFKSGDHIQWDDELGCLHSKQLIKHAGSDILLINNYAAYDDILGDVNDLKIWMMLICGMSIIASVIASHWVLRKMMSPVTELTDKADRLASGDLDITFLSMQNDEIGRLAKTFTSLVANVKEQQIDACMYAEKIRQFNDELEHKVEDRTKELKEAMVRVEAAAVAKDNFLASMSHEIRTPINGIMGMAQILEDTELDESQREQVYDILQSSDSLLTIVNDILDFSKIESGHMPLSESEFNLRDTIDHALTILSPKIDKSNVDVYYEHAVDCPSYFYSDELRIKQIIINLLSNAIKFTESGYIHIHVQQLRSHAGIADVNIAINDTGIGMDASAQRKIFNRFTQAEEGNARKFGGTGLGLAISKQLAELLGGDLIVSSKQGFGSTFYLSLPLRIQQVEDLVQGSFSEQRVMTSCVSDLQRRSLQGLLSYLACAYTEVPGRSDLDRSLRTEDDGVTVLVDESHVEDWPAYDALCEKNASAIIVMTKNPEAFKSFTRIIPLSKPIGLQRLCACLSSVFGKSFHNKKAIKTSSAVAALRLDILLVEDNRINQKVAKRVLEDFGATVTIAQNGIEAVQQFQQRSFNLILMDCQMPDMDGFEATRIIRAFENEHAKVKTCIVALTANAMSGDRERCLEAGMDDFLSKPFKKDELYKMVKEFGFKQAGKEESEEAEKQNT